MTRKSETQFTAAKQQQSDNDWKKLMRDNRRVRVIREYCAPTYPVERLLEVKEAQL